MLTLGLDIGGSSVKAALLADGRPGPVARSDVYDQPDRAALTLAMGQAAASVLEGVALTVDRIGLCAPGLLDRGQMAITKSINLPGIVGMPLGELVASAVEEAGHVHAPHRLALVTSDAHATAYDLYATEGLQGRLLCLALGTGVGGAVLDDGVPLHISGETPGHLGHLDVCLDEHPPAGPDGSRGTLESYIGLRALLRSRAIAMPEAPVSAPGAAPDAAGEPSFDAAAMEPPLRALARALRICHAVYRPQHVRLAGGVGVRLGPFLPRLRALVEPGLTSLARTGWTLGCGGDDFHAARGVARLAGGTG
ncbi:MAG TPA: ROK family protein [Phycisphaerales bacterium]|nr:ROK family protein [Phycisphaerales bacterium]